MFGLANRTKITENIWNPNMFGFQTVPFCSVLNYVESSLSEIWTFGFWTLTVSQKSDQWKGQVFWNFPKYKDSGWDGRPWWSSGLERYAMAREVRCSNPSQALNFFFSNFSLINFLFRSFSPWMPNLLLNEACKVLLQSTQSVINVGQTIRMTSWTYPMEERKKKQTSRAIKYSICNVSLNLDEKKIESIEYTKDTIERWSTLKKSN